MQIEFGIFISVRVYVLDDRSLNTNTFRADYVLMGMPFPRKRDARQFTEPELRKLDSIRKSRTEEKRRTVRAALLLDSLSGQSDETSLLSGR